MYHGRIQFCHRMLDYRYSMISLKQNKKHALSPGSMETSIILTDVFCRSFSSRIWKRNLLEST